MDMPQRQWFRKSLSFVLVVLFVLSTLVTTVTAAQALDRQQTSQSQLASRPSAEDYYKGLNTTLSGSAFRAELAALVKETHTKYTSYAGLANLYKTADADPEKSGNIIWFYTGTSVSFSGFGSGGGTTNREHVWPKDGGRAFDPSSGPGSDGHHLRPTEANLNSTRGSKSFGEVPQTSSNIVKQNGSISYENLCYTSGNFFYPGEGYRGATARILMYMQVRWGDQYNLKFVTGSGSCKTIGDIATLMKWHLEEPVTEAEIRRNEAVYAAQGNRNPFIDHPEYAEKIFCYDGESYNAALKEVVKKYGTSDPVPVTKITLSAPASLAVGETIVLIPQLTPSNATSTLLWESSDPSVVTVASGRVTALKQGSATVTVRSADDSSVKASVSVTVKAVTQLAVVGAPQKTSYTAGETFDPTGITLSVAYSDGSTDTFPGSAATWLDGVTMEKTLSKGTTEVVCSLGGLQVRLPGITVKASGKTSLTVSRESFGPDSGAYAFVSWTSGGISGKAYMYPGNKTAIQMNSSKSSRYLFNTTPLPSGILSITVKMQSGSKQWELLTSDTPFGEVDGVPTTGKSAGVKTVTEEGVTWTLDGNAKYFSLNYKDTGVAYLGEITITYGAAAACDGNHTFGDWKITQEPTTTSTGTAVRVCSECGEVETKTLPMLDAVSVFRDTVEVAVEMRDDGCTEERFILLVSALMTYADLTEEQQTAVADAYAVLLAEIAAYNDEANGLNTRHGELTDTATAPVSGLAPDAADGFHHVRCDAAVGV